MMISSAISTPLSRPTTQKAPSQPLEAAPADDSNASKENTATQAAGKTGAKQLQPSELAELQSLKVRDREVRAHEMAHAAAGGQYVTSGAQFSYQKGPDGRLYAVGGEVGISTSPVAGDPRATLQKAQTIMRAALAPAEPSSRDRQVAASAAAMLQQARAELQTLQYSRQMADQSANGQNLDLQV